jgi:hypothetical protein
LAVSSVNQDRLFDTKQKHIKAKILKTNQFEIEVEKVNGYGPYLKSDYYHGKNHNLKKYCDPKLNQLSIN